MLRGRSLATTSNNARKITKKLAKAAFEDPAQKRWLPALLEDKLAPPVLKAVVREF